MKSFLEAAQEAARGAGQLVMAHYLDSHKIENKTGFDFVTEMDQMSETYIRNFISSRFPDHHFFCEEQVSSGRMDEDEWLSQFSGYTWVVDAIDGTTNFIRKIPQFVISIALVHDREIIAGAVYDPSRDELFSAAKGKGAFCNGMPIHVSAEKELRNIILSVGFPASDMEQRSQVIERLNLLGMEIGSLRVFNCAALLLCYVASGRTNASFEQGIHLWDMAAGVLIVREAGGVALKLDGTPFHIESRENLVGNPDICRAILERIH